MKNRQYLCLIVCLAIAGCTKKSSESSDIVDKIRLRDLNNQQIDLHKFDGKVIFINFWATWCGPCIREMPSIERATKILDKEKVEFLLASNEALDRIQEFSAKKGLDLNYAHIENMEELNIQVLPTTYIINRKGELVFSEAGQRKWDDPANIDLINKILNEDE